VERDCTVNTDLSVPGVTSSGEPMAGGLSLCLPWRSRQRLPHRSSVTALRVSGGEEDFQSWTRVGAWKAPRTSARWPVAAWRRPATPTTDPRSAARLRERLPGDCSGSAGDEPWRNRDRVVALGFRISRPPRAA